MSEFEKVTLVTINNGNALKLFRDEYKKVIENIKDKEIKSDAAREIKLVFKITPSNERKSALVVIEASSKIVDVVKDVGAISIGLTGEFVANQEQVEMEFNK